MPIASDLARAIERRDPYSLGHAARVSVLAEIVAARLGWDEEEIEALRLGAALHDIGKLAVPSRSCESRALSIPTSSPRCAPIPSMAPAWYPSSGP